MNPNMMGMPMGQLPDVPTTKELWKNEKEKYRHWVILFGIGILVIFALMLTSLIISLTNEVSIKANVEEWMIKHPDSLGENASKLTPDKLIEVANENANKYWKIDIVTYTSIKTALLFIGVVLYVDTIIKCYKAESFAKLSQWASFVVGISALVGLFEIFKLIWGSRVIFSYPEGIYQFFLFILPMFIWYFISRPLNKIKRSFILSERVEAYKNSPQYAQMQQQMEAMQRGEQVQPNPMGPFGPVPPQTPVKPNVATPVNPAAPKTELTPAEKRRKQLSQMNSTELKEIAKKLSISGYSSMKKAELIENIIRVSGE